MDTSSRMRSSCSRCHASHSVTAQSASAAPRTVCAQPATGLRRGERVDRGPEPVDELGEAAGEVDRAAVDVVEGEHAAHEAAVLLGHRDPGEQPVEARRATCSPRWPRARTARGGRRRAPSGPRSRRPSARGGPGRRRRARSAAAPARGRRGRAPGRRSAARRRARAAGHHAEHRVRLAQRPVGEPHPEVGRRARRPPSSDPSAAKVACTSGAKVSTSGHITRMSRGSSVGSSARACRIASRSTSTWRRAAVAGVDLQAPVGGVERHALVGPAAQRRARRRPVGPHVGLEPGEQGAGRLVERPVVVDGPPARPARAASRARPGPRSRAAG